jgi:hypothetical protein
MRINSDIGSGMMAELGYAGQLELHEGKREIDFSSYGLKINVKFRSAWYNVSLSYRCVTGAESFWCSCSRITMWLRFRRLRIRFLC